MTDAQIRLAYLAMRAGRDNTAASSSNGLVDFYCPTCVGLYRGLPNEWVRCGLCKRANQAPLHNQTKRPSQSAWQQTCQCGARLMGSENKCIVCEASGQTEVGKQTAISFLDHAGASLFHAWVFACRFHAWVFACRALAAAVIVLGLVHSLGVLTSNKSMRDERMKDAERQMSRSWNDMPDKEASRRFVDGHRSYEVAKDTPDWMSGVQKLIWAGSLLILYACVAAAFLFIGGDIRFETMT